MGEVRLKLMSDVLVESTLNIIELLRENFLKDKGSAISVGKELFHLLPILIRHYFFIPPILKGRYTSHTCVCRRYCGRLVFAADICGRLVYA